MLILSNLDLLAANCQISRLFLDHESFFGYFINGCSMALYCVFYFLNRLYFEFEIFFFFRLYSSFGNWLRCSPFSAMLTRWFFPSISVNNQYQGNSSTVIKSCDALTLVAVIRNRIRKHRERTTKCIKGKKYRIFNFNKIRNVT